MLTIILEKNIYSKEGDIIIWGVNKNKSGEGVIKIIFLDTKKSTFFYRTG